MTRIIAGTCGGRQIATPPGKGTRPTSDRVREALFSSLEADLGGFEGLWILDLFAGSGALGLESLSRGATGATFVESDARAVAVIKQNIRVLAVPNARVIRSSASAYADRPQTDPFDVIFLDPPYHLKTEAISNLVSRLALVNHATFVVERSTRDPFVWPDNVQPARSKKYGETTLWYGHTHG